MLIKERFEQYDFSNSEKAIIDFILEKKNEIRHMTTKEIAQATFTSPSTLIRIAHKMNFKGWNELKDAYLNELTYLETHFCGIDANYPFSEKDNIMTIANKIAQLKKETIEDTLSLITHDELQKAVQIISRASYVNVFAVSNNLLISQEFKHNMNRIGKKVDINYLQGEPVHTAYNADPSSCAIIISYSGETPILKNVANALRAKNIPIIGITNIGTNTLARLSTVVLKITTREKQYSKIATFSTDEAITFLLDVIYSCIFSENYKENDNRKYHNSKSIETGRFSTLDIIKENEY